MEALNIAWGAFITMAFGLAAYAIHRYFNYKDKKAELKYSFFQEHKIKAIVKFFDCYGKAERMWHHLPIYKVIDHKISAEELDNIIWPVMNPLNTSVCELNLYMDKTEIGPFRLINERLLDLNMELQNLYDNIDTRTTLGNKYNLALFETITECQKLLKQIGETTRRSFVK